MDYRKELSRTLNLNLLEPIVQSGLYNVAEFEKIFTLLYDDSSEIAWRAAWACEKISLSKPDYFQDNHINVLIKIAVSTQNYGLLRTCLVLLKNLSAPKSIDIELMNACYDWLSSELSPIAVKALAMKILYKFCLIEPDLKPEFIATLEHLDNLMLSAAVQATKKNVIKLLKNN
jgi:hypothetical protein